MMSVLEFIFKIITFCVTFYYLVEYIFMCKINTGLGLSIVVMCMLFIIMYHQSKHNLGNCLNKIN